MSLPPDILFHRYFQTPAWERRNYRGKHTLEAWDPPLQPLLAAIQETINDGFNSVGHIPPHAKHDPFHFDFIDADSINAYAFRDAGYSFIGITARLVYRLWDLSSHLSRSEVILRPSGVKLTVEEWCEAVRVVLFRIALRFVVLHEWTHHVHGHLGAGPEETVFSEILDKGEYSSPERQVWEVDADCYAAYQILVGFLDGGWLNLLSLNEETPITQDDALLSCFVVGIGALMFALSSGKLFSEEKIHEDPHPPQAARMNCIMYQAGRWRMRCRPDFAAWMPVGRFQALMRAVAEAAFEGNLMAWDQQSTFLASEGGIAYMTELDRSLTAYKQSFQAIV